MDKSTNLAWYFKY